MKKIEITHTTFSNFIKELKPQFDDAEMTGYYTQNYYENEETNGAMLGFNINLNGTEKTKKGEYERHLYIEFTCIDSTKKCYIKTIDATYRKIYHFENGKTRFSQKLSTDTLPNELQKRVADIVLFVETIVLAYLKEIDKKNEENKTTDELIEEQVLEEGITILTNEEFEKLYPNWSVTNEFNQYDNLPNKHFIILSDNMFVTIDNTDKCCWVEEFKTKEDAIKWLNNEDL